MLGMTDIGGNCRIGRTSRWGVRRDGQVGTGGNCAVLGKLAEKWGLLTGMTRYRR